MTCEEVQKRLIDLAYPEPAAEPEMDADRRELERHVEQCQTCAQALAEMTWTRDVVAAAATTLSADNRHVSAGHVHRAVTQRAEVGRRRWRRLAWLATAAALLVAVWSISQLRIEAHPSHLVLAWGDWQPSPPQIDAASNTAISLESVEGLQQSVAGHQRRLIEINRLLDLVVTELNRSHVRQETTLASFVHRLDTVERQNNERWKAIGRGFHDWYLERALAEATPASAAVKGDLK
jgi:hypothetical protein